MPFHDYSYFFSPVIVLDWSCLWITFLFAKCDSVHKYANLKKKKVLRWLLYFFFYIYMAFFVHYLDVKDGRLLRTGHWLSSPIGCSRSRVYYIKNRPCWIETCIPHYGSDRSKWDYGPINLIVSLLEWGSVSPFNFPTYKLTYSAGIQEVFL